MSSALFRKSFTLGVLTLAVAAATPAMAEFTLDSRYQDADGDLIADIPTSESDWRDPSTLVFAYTPVEDPAVYAGVWSEFLAHMETETGKPVQFFPVQSNAAQIEAMRAGRLHIAGFNTGSNPLAVACSGYRPFAMMAAADGSFGYEMEIITHPDSGFDSIEDLRGQQLAFTSQTSNSGFKAPSAILKAEYKMEPGRDFEAVFSGKHDNSILGVANQDYPAAAIANSVLNRMLSRDIVAESQIKTLYTSQTFPTTSYGLAHDLHPDLQDAIQNAFFSFDWSGTQLKAEFSNSGEAQFIPITFQKEWSIIRQIDDANGVQYSCQ